MWLSRGFTTTDNINKDYIPSYELNAPIKVGTISTSPNVSNGRVANSKAKTKVSNAYAYVFKSNRVKPFFPSLKGSSITVLYCELNQYWSLIVRIPQFKLVNKFGNIHSIKIR